MRGYYQAANRMATLYFVQREQIPARLLFIYFLGDQVPTWAYYRVKIGDI